MLPVKFGSIFPGGSRGEDNNVKVYRWGKMDDWCQVVTKAHKSKKNVNQYLYDI